MPAMSGGPATPGLLEFRLPDERAIGEEPQLSWPVLGKQPFHHVAMVFLGLVEHAGGKPSIGFNPRHPGDQFGGKRHGRPVGHWYTLPV